MTLKQLGIGMLNWHSGQWDPVYAVGSFFLDGKDHPQPEYVIKARDVLKRVRAQVKHKEATRYGRRKKQVDLRSLHAMIAALDAYILVRGIVEPAV